MYSSEDLERFYFQYQTEATPKGGWASLLCSRKSNGGKSFTRSIDGIQDFFRSYTRGVAHEQWPSSHPEESKLSGAEGSDREVGGLMLSVTGITRFYYLRDFTDMRC